jgi:hypothetical protein
VDIACPEDCTYLTGAHAGAWEGRDAQQHRDLMRLAPQLQLLSDEQGRLVFLTLAGLAGIRSARRDLDDRLVEQALTALQRTIETRQRGLLYDHHPEDPRAEGLLVELKGLYQARDEAGQSVEPSDPDLLAALQELREVVAQSLQESRGPMAFLDLATRVAARMGATPARQGPLIVSP